MLCQECGKEMPNDSLFCPECGVKQEQKPVDVVILSSNTGKEPLNYCSNCGSQIPADSRFCPECRFKQENAPPIPQKQRTPQQTPEKVSLSPEEEAKIKKRNKMIAITIGAALALCLVIGILSVFIKPTINLNSYLTVSYEGYDTFGKAIITFDTEKFRNDYEKKFNSKTRDNLYGSGSATSNFLVSCVDGALDFESGLSNGDVVTYIWSCDDEYALQTYGYKLKYKNVEYTVSDLMEAGTFDPFEGIKVVFNGISPSGSASIEGEPIEYAAQDLRYEFDTNEGLSNGDVITVTATLYYSDNPVEYFAENYGMIPNSLIKTYTVEGLDSYIRSISDVSEECMLEMQLQAEYEYNNNVTQNWDDDEILKSLTYIGNYLMINKDSDENWGSDNVLYLVYKARVKNKYSITSETYNETNDIYWYIAYYDLLVNPDGITTVDVTNYSTPSETTTIDSGISDGWWSTKSWDYYGYHTLDILFDAIVTPSMESYNYEDNIDESVTTSETEEEIVGEEGIIFPNSSKELIDESAVHELSDEELKYAINELYARNGYIFKDDNLSIYYEQFDWYEKTVKADDFSMDLFNDIEKENIEIFQKERDSRN